MSIRERIPRDQIERDFTHYALFCRVVPVYYKEIPPDGCCMAVRNWWPEWLMDAAEAVLGVVITIKSAMDRDYVPMYPIKLTREINPA